MDPNRGIWNDTPPNPFDRRSECPEAPYHHLNMNPKNTTAMMPRNSALERTSRYQQFHIAPSTASSWNDAAQDTHGRHSHQACTPNVSSASMRFVGTLSPHTAPVLPPIISTQMQKTRDMGNHFPPPPQQLNPPRAAELSCSNIQLPNAHSSTAIPKSRRQCRSAGPTDWETHRAAIKTLYLDQNLSLSEVQEKMEGDFGFISSDKLYKDKLDEWGYVKNLPKKTAIWVLEKDKLRQNQGKETVYKFGGRPLKLSDVEKKAKRIKVESDEKIPISFKTPKHLTYFTPVGNELVLSPQCGVTSAPTSRPSKAAFVRQWNPPPRFQEPGPGLASSSWRGYTTAQLAALHEDAQSLVCLEQIEQAEDKFRLVLDGFDYLSSSTDQNTCKVAYELANFYAKNQRPHDANAVLEWMSREHIACWGVNHPKTAAHDLQVAEFYQKWSQSDNLPFEFDASQPPKNDREKLNYIVPFSQISGTDSGVVRHIAEHATDLSTFSHQLAKAKLYAQCYPEDAEPVLLRLISQNENNQTAVPVSHLFDARCTLAKIYQARSELQKLSLVLENAQSTFHEALIAAPEHLAMTLKTSVILVNMLLKAGLEYEAESMLEKIETHMNEELEEDGVDFVAILVALGRLYQDHDRWAQAELHLQHALAISIRFHRLECIVVRVLEAALENQVFAVNSVDPRKVELEVRQHGFVRCGCGGFTGELSTAC